MKFHKEAEFQKRKAKGWLFAVCECGRVSLLPGGLCEVPVPALAVLDAVVFMGSPRRTTGTFQVECSGPGSGTAGAGGGGWPFQEVAVVGDGSS